MEGGGGGWAMDTGAEGKGPADSTSSETWGSRSGREGPA